MIPIGLLAKNCVQFISTFSNKYSNMELLVILFLYKLYAHINIFKNIEEKYEQLEIKLTRNIQKQHPKITKIKYDIN